MKKSLIIQGLALLLCVCACSVEIETPVQTPTQLTFSATMGDNPATKTHLSSDGKSPLWNAGDAINVFYGELSSGKFTSTSGNNVVSASFSGSLNVMSGTIEAGAGARKFFGVYPYADDNTCDGTSVTTTILSTQVSDAGSFATGMSPSVARSDNLDLAFYNICGGIAFSVKEAGITSITFTGNNDEAIAGKVKVGFDSNGKPVIEEVLSKATSVTVKPSTGTFKNDGTLYYALLLPQTYSQGLTFSFTKAGQRGQFVRTKSTTLARSVFGRLLNIDDGVEFIDDGTGGGEYDWSIIPADLVTVNNPTKGGLEDVLLEWGDYESITSLKVTGTMNDVDFLVIYRDMPNLRYLDISGIDNTTLPSKAFYKSTNVTHVILPEALTEIGDELFKESKLVTVKIKQNVKTIGDQAFYNCSTLTSIEIPSSVENIGENAFQSCSALVSVTFEGGSSLKTIGYHAFYYCGALTSIEIPASAETIEKEAFKFSALVSVTFENGSSLRTIDYQVFYGCVALTSIEIPASVETIEEVAFGSCEALVSVTFESGSSLKTIGEGAFYGCVALTSIEIPASVETIGESAFSVCPALVSVTFESGSSLKTLGNDVFFNCGALTSIKIPASVVKIGESAFGYCSALVSVTFESGSSLKTIGNNTFSGCSALTSIEIPSSVETIGGTAFYRCALTSIEIPSSVETIEERAFEACSALVSVTFASNSKLRVLESGVFKDCSKLAKVSFGENAQLVTIKQAFNGCTSLKTFDASGCASLTQIDNSVFYGLSKLRLFYCGAATPPTIGYSTFSGIDPYAVLKVPDGSVDSYKAVSYWNSHFSQISGFNE